MRNSPEEIARYQHSIINCPKCHKEGQLLYRSEHGKRFWVVRHRMTEFDDRFCHVGSYLPIHIKDAIDGKKMKTLDSF
jgi:hypothetical protein